MLLLNRPFGFVALLGVIALMGMIQRNSVILIDQIEQDRARGVPGCRGHHRGGGAALPAYRAHGGRSGPGHDPAVAQRVLGPMAVAIMGGLVVATVLTLLALPAMYAAWFRVGNPGRAAGRDAGHRAVFDVGPEGRQTLPFPTVSQGLEGPSRLAVGTTCRSSRRATRRHGSSPAG